MRYQLQLSRNEAALEAKSQTLGWRLYGLNAPAVQFSLAQAFLAYRGAPNIERDFSRLKGRPLGLRPVYLHREDHLKDLVRLLSLALRLLTLLPGAASGPGPALRSNTQVLKKANASGRQTAPDRV